MKKTTAIILSLVMLLTINAFAAFSDVDSSTAEGIAIDKLSEIGVLGGFDDGTFRPAETVTREQFAKILYVLVTGNEEAPAVTSSDFTDVDTGRWSAGFIKWASDEGIVGGMGDGTFAPDSTLTMAAASKMLVVAYGASNDLAWPQGFIDAADEMGLYEDVADVNADAPAPRGTIALMAYNSIKEDDTDPEPTGLNTVEVVALTAVSASEISYARLGAKDLGQKIDMIEMVNTTTIFFSLVNETSVPLASNCVVRTAEGAFYARTVYAEGSISDLVASDSDNFYTAKITVANGEVTAIDYMKQGVPYSYKQLASGYLALPSNQVLYYAPGVTTEMALGTFVEANSGTMGELMDVTQPEKGTVKLAKSGRRFRVDFTVPKDAAVGDELTFTWTCQTSDRKITSTAIVTVKLVQGTEVQDKTITVAPGGVITPEPAFWYEGVKYAAGAPSGVPSFLVYNEAEQTTVAVGASYTTNGGGSVVRNMGDMITYTAPDKAGTDEFYLSLHDGIAPVLVKVTVIIEE